MVSKLSNGWLAEPEGMIVYLSQRLAMARQWRG